MEWYTVSTKLRQEQQAVLYLDTLGLETFCPLLKKRKMVRRKWQDVMSPFFPGYIFARFDIHTRFRAVSYAKGVRRVVAFGNAPVPVDEKIIAEIRARLTNGCVTFPSGSLKSGQCVRIKGGPLEGLEAIFEREISDHQRVVVLLRTIAAHWRVLVPLDQVVNL